MTDTRERVLSRMLAEIDAGLRHGYFTFTLTCEVIGQGRRRLILHAGKSYQFVIAGDECEPTDGSNTPLERRVVDSGASPGSDNNTFGGSQGKPNDS